MQAYSSKFEMDIVGFPAKVLAPSSSFSIEKTRPRIDHVSTIFSSLFDCFIRALFWAGYYS